MTLLRSSDPSAPAATVLDALTGLPTYDAILGALGRDAAEGGPGPAVVLLLRLNRLRGINDTLGHATGDALLRAAARRLSRAIRPGDLLGRLGGGEFVVLLPAPAGEAEGTDLADRLLDLLARPFLLNGHSVVVGCHIGIALHPEDAADGDGLLRAAGLALRHAKAERQGRCRYMPSLHARAEARRQLEDELRAAIALGQLEMQYQPYVDLASGRIAGFEALLRWRHPERGVLPPSTFMPLAEETGLIVPLGEWVLRTTCRDAAAWPDPSLTVAVNVSAVQLARPDFAERVGAALAAAGLAPARLELEITETALLQDVDEALGTCRMLRSLGVRLSLDDFGTGYSSLTQLRDFPLDRVKVDRSFVTGLEGRPESAAIVHAVAGLGAALGLRTTAEGVETPAELAELRGSGFTHAQGFLLGRPVPNAGVTALLGGQGAPASPTPEDSDGRST